MEKRVLSNISQPDIGILSNNNQYLEGIFRIESYQICKNWLATREGRPINHEDTQHYQRIVILLKEMVKLMEEIKTKIHCNEVKKLELFQKVRAIVVEKLGIKPEQITPIVNFAIDLGADSLDTVELVIALEETFAIEIPAPTAETLLTVQEVIDYISQKLEIAV